MTGRILAALLLASPLPATTQEAVAAEEPAVEITWPIPWKAGTKLEYDQRYRRVRLRDGKELAMTGTDRVVVEIVHADDNGFVQRWTSTDPKLDTGGLPAEAAATVKAAVEAMHDLPLDVSLDREGGYLELTNMDELHRRYSAAIREMLSGMVDAAGETDASGEAMLENMISMLTSRPVLEQELAELPAAYNFVAGGGLELDAEYEYEEEGVSPLGGEPIPMWNRLAFTQSDDPDLYAVRWVIEPDADAIAPILEKAVAEMLAPVLQAAGSAEAEDSRRALEEMTEKAQFSTTISFLIDKSSGIVERLEHKQLQSLGPASDTRTTVLQRRH